MSFESEREALHELLGPILHLPISEIRDRILAAGFRRTEVPEPSAEPDLMDRLKDSLRIKPQGKPSDLIQRLIDLRGDMRHNADEVATLDAAITALRAQGELSDAQEVEFPFTHDGVTLEQDGGGIWTSGPGLMTYWIQPKVLAALRAAGGADRG